MQRVYLAILLIIVTCGAANAAQKLTYVDLVKRLTDLSALAILPVAGENCAQFSSYDRASQYDEQTGKYIKWDANGDNDGIVRMEGDQQVFGEVEGPGCIWRIWSAMAGAGHVKIYLDGAKEPAVDLPFIGYFDGKNAPFNYPALVHVVSRGLNNYVPIPFQKSCKIVADKDWGAYYHFTYSSFPKGTVVPTFTRSLPADALAALAAADKALSTDLGKDPVTTPEEVAAVKQVGPGAYQNLPFIRSQITVKPGKSMVAAELGGPSAITAMKVANSLSPTALREVVMRIRWDDEKQPSMWCPIGDFFGTAPGVNLYKSLPMGMREDAFYSNWYMPFAKKAIVEFINEGSEDAKIDVTIWSKKLKDVKNLGRFHAKWHRDVFLPTEPERWIDWPILKTTGRGRFVGVSLHVFNPRGGWWGEGDEKFFVDGEKFPSTFGTGSEDYFGYAWCDPNLFQNAYHNQPYNENSNAGSISVNRWQIADNIPFHTSFEGDIEKYFPNANGTQYACVAYWYEAPGGGDPYGPTPVSERVGYYKYERFTVPGAIEAERMKASGATGGDPTVQGMGPFGGNWSDNTQFFWVGAKPGDKVDLELPVKSDGAYELKTQFTKAADYAIVQLYLDGAKLGEPIDLYNDGVIATGEVSLGAVNLIQGNHKITIEIVGANDKAQKSYLVGIDYFKLDPTR